MTNSEKIRRNLLEKGKLDFLRQWQENGDLDAHILVFDTTDPNAVKMLEKSGGKLPDPPIVKPGKSVCVGLFKRADQLELKGVELRPNHFTVFLYAAGGVSAGFFPIPILKDGQNVVRSDNDNRV